MSDTTSDVEALPGSVVRNSRRELPIQPASIEPAAEPHKTTSPTTPTVAPELMPAVATVDKAPPRAEDSTVGSTATPAAAPQYIRPGLTETGEYVSEVKLSRFDRLLSNDSIELASLRDLAWNGTPPQYRPTVWRCLLGYLPLHRRRRETHLRAKRDDYRAAVDTYFTDREVFFETEQSRLRQVVVDIPRTCPGIPLFRTPQLQQRLERLLYVWAVRHPASGYVQGMNDLASPIFAVLLSPFANLETSDLSAVPESTLDDIEADVYWCLTSLLDGIQDHYTPSQPGLQRMIFQLQELVTRLDAPLVAHLEAEGVQFLHIAFQWMNCYLARELPLPLVIRLWDTYLAEPDGFERFHVYVCAALILQFADEFKSRDNMGIQQFLSNIPTKSWSFSQVEELLSKAFINSAAFEASPKHLR